MAGTAKPWLAEDVLRRRVKIELRKRMRGLRAALPATASAERSGRIVRALLALPPLAAARTVALFWPMEGRREVDLRELDAILRARGARVAYPVLEPPERGMTFHFPSDPLAMDSATIPGLVQPSRDDPRAEAGELEAIVVPALAVDPAGHRIGYGGGHYDATLPRFAPPASAIAVAFDFQLVAEVPATGGDVPVAWVVTDARTLAAAP